MNSSLSRVTDELRCTNITHHQNFEVLVTLTTVLIELSVIETQRRVFESFVEVTLLS